MSSLSEMIQVMPPPFNMIAFIALVFAVAGVLSSLAKQVRKYLSHRQELEFKRELLDRGLAIDEIERVVASQQQSTRPYPLDSD